MTTKSPVQAKCGIHLTIMWVLKIHLNYLVSKAGTGKVPSFGIRELHMSPGSTDTVAS